MMGPRQVDQAALFYEFSLERHVPATHLLMAIDRFVDLSDVRRHLSPFYSSKGRPPIDPDLFVRMLLVADGRDFVVRGFGSDRGVRIPRP
jgi:transposase